MVLVCVISVLILTERVASFLCLSVHLHLCLSVFGSLKNEADAPKLLCLLFYLFLSGLNLLLTSLAFGRIELSAQVTVKRGVGDGGQVPFSSLKVFWSAKESRNI